MLIAREGFKEILLSTSLLAALGLGAYWLYPPLAIPFALVWIWVIAFFRDPIRRTRLRPGELCAPADGTVTEITKIDQYGPLNGPAIRIGLFLSLFNVHINRASCSGRVRSLAYRSGEFLDARHPESGRRNEQNVILIDTEPPMPGPVEIRQVAGMVARRIICHARANSSLTAGERFGMIKFGSRTELIIPAVDGTCVEVQIGDKVKAGITVMARQPVPTDRENEIPVAAGTQASA